ncbi:MAG: KdsC family phosphatase [Pseudobdellovibrionaceae bacterium]
MNLQVSQLKTVKMLVLDVDGILTDCRIWLSDSGEWRRRFSIRDGAGIKLLQEAGYKIAIITGSKAEDIRKRAEHLKIDYFFEGALDKEPSFQELQKKSGLKPQEMAYMGDDYFDVPVLSSVAFAATVSDAMESAKEVCHYVAARPAGTGAVREVCELILKYGAFAKGKTT